MAAESFEDRISALEQEVARLRNKIEPDSEPWWKQWVGAFLNDPYFEEAMKLGRKWRQSDRPKPRKNRKKGNGHS